MGNTIISVRHAASAESFEKMILTSFLFGLFINSISSAHFYGGFGYHGYHAKCERQLEVVTKKFCRIEVEKECETKTKTYTKITGHGDTDCKEIEVCKHAIYHHGPGFDKRAAEAEAGHFGYAAIECEKETKTVCKKKPTTEKVSKDFELCRPKPNEVCEDKEIKVPKLICEDEEDVKQAEEVETI